MISGKSLLQIGEFLQLSKCQLSAKAGSNRMIKPPVSMYGVDGRYATALYSAAAKRNKLDQVDQNLKRLLELNKSDAKFHDFLINPLIKANQKCDILSKQLSSKLNLDELTVNLIMVLSENGRMKYFPNVARAFNRSMALSRGEMNISVTSSSKLDEESNKELMSILQSFCKGKKLIVSYKTDSSILGGLIIDFDGERYVDMSIKKKFNQYANLLKQPV